MTATITSVRLSLPAATVEELNAAIDGNRTRFIALTDANPPDPFVAPPETGDVLEWFRDAILADPAIRPWFFRWIIDRRIGALIGSAGCAGRPNEFGHVLIGYCVYPEFERRGYASEAAKALVDWALEQDGVSAVRATIRPGHQASQGVARRAGMRMIELISTESDGPVELWSIDKPAS